MIYEFHPQAVVELNQAIDYYEDIESGLGYEFAAEVYAAIQRAVAFPKAWTIFDGDIRRSFVKRFPYGILYSLEQDRLFIIAVMNLHREPIYWKDRE